LRTRVYYLLPILIIELVFNSFVVAQNDTLPTPKNDTVVLNLPKGDTIQQDSIIVKQTKKNIFTEPELDSNSVNYFFGSIDSLKYGKLHYIDTATYYFQQYDPLFHRNGLYSTLSNIGLAQTNLEFSPTLSVGYYFENSSFTKYIYENNQVKYYKLFIPYSELTYVLGSKKEQNFQVELNRELFKGFTIGIDFAMNFAPGYYDNSKANDKRLFITGQYYTKNLRYGIVANYLINNLLVEENGGIETDSIFEQNLITERANIAVNLTSASNKIRQSGFFVEQYFNLLKPASDTTPRKIDAGHISWAIHFQRNQMLYIDNNPVSDFYAPNNQPYDPEQTYDSVFQSRIRNKFKWSSVGYHDQPGSKLFKIYFGVIYDYIEQDFPSYPDKISVINNLSKMSFSQITPFGGIGLNILKSFRLNAYAEYVLGDHNNGDLKLSAAIHQFLGNESRNIGRFSAGIDFVSRSPEWYFQNYQSNMYRWSNDFKKTTTMVIFGEYFYKYALAGVKFYTFGNYTYFDETKRPAQLSATETVLQFYISGLIPIKKFGINTKLVYQETSNARVLKYPVFTGVLDLFFRSRVFKNAATLQTGIQLYYFSKFSANSYMPAYRNWYLQDDKVIGNYVYADAYVTLKVKRARIFLKYAHFNSLFGNYNYYLAPHYPARDARFELGVSWRFHN